MEQTRSAADAEFERLTGNYLAAYYARHPALATEMGVHDFDDQLDNFNRFALREAHDQARAYLHAMDPLSLADLSFENRLDYRLARSAAQMELAAYERQKWPETQPGTYLQTVFRSLLPLIMRSFAPPDTRALGLLGRLRAIPIALQEAAQNLKNPPALFTASAIESAVASETLFTEALPAFIARLPSTSLQKALNDALTGAHQAVQTYARYLKETVLPQSKGDFALGRKLYDYHLRVGHLMTEDSETLLQIGLEAVEETKRALIEQARRIAPDISWQEQIAQIKKEHPTANTLTQAYTQAMEHARQFIVERDLMTLPQNERLRVTETPAFARPFLPFTAYVPPAPFEPRKEGVFWVTPIDASAAQEQQEAQLQGHAQAVIPVIALHEAYPGHHLQLCHACQRPSRIRRHFAQSNLFIEGWALYCEEMMWEEGFSADPRVRLMQLNATLWRACRVVLDVRLHTRGLPPEAAVRYLCEEAGLEEVHARAEVKRYIETPTQPMTYLIGKRALLGIREEMQRRMGAHFALKYFHDQLLSHGSLPPTLLREALFAVR